MALALETTGENPRHPLARGFFIVAPAREWTPPLTPWVDQGYVDGATIVRLGRSEQWDWEQNVGLDPAQTPISRPTVVAWVCRAHESQGHLDRWDAPIVERAKGSQCRCCTNRRVCRPTTGCSRPTTSFPGSREKVAWLCARGHTYPQRICARTRQGAGCPGCDREDHRARTSWGSGAAVAQDARLGSRRRPLLEAPTDDDNQVAEDQLSMSSSERSSIAGGWCRRTLLPATGGAPKAASPAR
jgi:hypothetical protein